MHAAGRRSPDRLIGRSRPSNGLHPRSISSKEVETTSGEIITLVHPQHRRQLRVPPSPGAPNRPAVEPLPEAARGFFRSPSPAS
jgi:hypothetical protein